MSIQTTDAQGLPSAGTLGRFSESLYRFKGEHIYILLIATTVWGDTTAAPTSTIIQFQSIRALMGRKGLVVLFRPPVVEPSDMAVATSREICLMPLSLFDVTILILYGRKRHGYICVYSGTRVSTN